MPGRLARGSEGSSGIVTFVGSVGTASVFATTVVAAGSGFGSGTLDVLTGFGSGFGVTAGAGGSADFSAEATGGVASCGAATGRASPVISDGTMGSGTMGGASFWSDCCVEFTTSIGSGGMTVSPFFPVAITTNPTIRSAAAPMPI